MEEKNKSLKITFLFKENGHVQIKYEKFRLFTNPRDLYIYVAVKKWEKEGGAKYSNNYWAELLYITREHAITVIENACDRGIIYKKIGTYTGSLIGSRSQKIQEINTYSIKPFVNEKIKIKQDESENESENESDNGYESVIDIHTISKFDLSFDKEEHNWNNHKDLTIDDFVFYLNNLHNKEIKEMCEKKISRILSRNEKFKFVMDKLIKEAEEIIESSERKEKEKEESQVNERIKKMIEQTDDIVLQINSELVPYKDYEGKGNDIEKIYYFQKEDISHLVDEDGAFILNLRNKVNPQLIDIYRKESGQWRESFHVETEDLANGE